MNTKYKILILLPLLAIFSFAFFPFGVEAAEQLTLTITPPLFQLNIGPGEFWASSIKIVNTNPYDLELYASVMNFEASGEAGQGKFIPLIQKEGEVVPNTLARWIEIEHGPFFVPREKSVEVPFSIRIPQDAPPGGHYAAILVGTQPPVETVKGASIQVSSFVSSLVFVRIKGEVVEEGAIREFFTERTFYQKPEVNFTLRFENKGNVHLQPQGDITIYNMWGKERGRIFINHKTNFGNVLPQSIRKFIFEWQGEENLFEVGRYKAVVTLTYGTEARQNISATTYFWVVPLAAMLGVLGGLTLIFLVSWFAIRAYIRRAVALYQKELVVPAPSTAYPPRIWLKPVVDGVIDLRAIMRKRSMRGAEAHEKGKKKFSAGLFQFLNAYRRFFSYLAFFVLAIAAVLFYVGEVRLPERNFDIILQDESGKKLNISPEEIIREKITEEKLPAATEQASTTIKVLNGSGIPGLAARVSLLLEEKGFNILAPANAKGFGYQETLIQYKKGKEEFASTVRRLLSGVGKLEEVELEDTDIVVIIGKDFRL